MNGGFVGVRRHQRL